jgi:hypothetical protein
MKPSILVFYLKFLKGKKHLFVDEVIGEYLRLNFFKDGKWKCVTVDKFLPVNNKNKLAFARCEDENEYWYEMNLLMK